jgi:hypothetical protein
MTLNVSARPAVIDKINDLQAQINLLNSK